MPSGVRMTSVLVRIVNHKRRNSNHRLHRLHRIEFGLRRQNGMPGLLCLFKNGAKRGRFAYRQKRQSGTLRLLCFLLFVSLTGTAHRILAFDSSYWVWHRTTSLTPEEVEELERQHVTKLYWEVGE